MCRFAFCVGLLHVVLFMHYLLKLFLSEVWVRIFVPANHHIHFSTVAFVALEPESRISHEMSPTDTPVADEDSDQEMEAPIRRVARPMTARRGACCACLARLFVKFLLHIIR